MPRVLVVEGLTDSTFFSELLSRLYLREATIEYDRRSGRRNIPAIIRGVRQGGGVIEIEFRNQEGKANIPDTIRGLLNQGVREFTVVQDLDDHSPDQVVQSIAQIVYTHLGIPLTAGSISDRTVEIEGGRISVTPMGLYQDTLLSQLGVTSHSVEDYLIKLMLEDAGLRQECPELQNLLLEITPSIRSYDGDFNSSKELFQLIKPIVQHGFSDTAVVQRIFSNTNADILRNVLSPILSDLEPAFSL